MAGYSISQVAERFGVEPHTLRFYEKEGIQLGQALIAIHPDAVFRPPAAQDALFLIKTQGVWR